jgi:diguanylate cyclase (GGDEF)-like protein
MLELDATGDPFRDKAVRPALGARWGATAGPLRHGGDESELRQGLDLIAELAEALPSSTPGQLFTRACARFVDLLAAARCSTWSEDYDRLLVLRDMAVDSALTLAERAALPAPEAVAGWLSELRSGRGRVPPGTGTLACGDGNARRPVCALAVPIGERAAFVVERFGPASWSPAQVRVVRIVAAMTEQTARAARRAREEREQTATAGALRKLLEIGIHARSSIEAAEALASTAAQVLDVPVACAYLVGDGGVITDVVSVGVSEELGARLRSQLVGKLARGSPVWCRTVEGPVPGPDLIDDTNRSGIVRAGGVAHTLELRSMATIPLLSSDGPLGLVLCGDHRPRERWRVGDRELLARLSLEGAVVVDNARLREAERYEATHDVLTGLRNRRAFTAALQEALATQPKGQPEVALLLLDLDRFKEVNDQLGHHRGDELLVAVGARLRRVRSGTDVLARLGGDEFAVLLTGDGATERAQTVANQISRVLEDPFEISGFLLNVEASIGIAYAPAHARDAGGLLQMADAAMYQAKRAGTAHVVYGPGVSAQPNIEIGMIGELRRALVEPRQLELHYQPKVDLRTGRPTGVEALVRWEHPQHGLVGPERFVPMAEETGLVRALTRWVVPEALAQVKRWSLLGIDLPVSVNVSAHDLAEEQFAELVAGWLASAGMPGRRLVVEVTEGSLMRDHGAAGATLDRLRAMGVRVSLDDVGTGYSSLAHLATLPVDEIKVDHRLLEPARHRAPVVRAIASLGHDLAMTVVAEGVEDAQDASWLAAVGCDEAQGFHFRRPCTPAALEPWLLRNRP